MNQIIIGEACLELSKIADSSVDAIITDPPYLITDLDFDKQGFNVDEFCKQASRVLKSNGYFASFGGIELFALYLKYFRKRFTGVWLKHKPVIRTHSAKKPMSLHEQYIVMTKPNAKISALTWNLIKIADCKPYRKVQHNAQYKRNGHDQLDRSNTSSWTKENFVSSNEGFRYQTDVISGANKATMAKSERSIHPTQKPISIMQVMVQWLTNPNDIVLDPFCGSGSTLLAAEMLQRQWLGIEINSEYAAIAQKRIAQYQQTSRFQWGGSHD